MVWSRSGAMYSVEPVSIFPILICRWIIPFSLIFCLFAWVTVKSEPFNFILLFFRPSKIEDLRSETSDPESINAFTCLPMISTLHIMSEPCVNNSYSSALFLLGLLTISRVEQESFEFVFIFGAKVTLFFSFFNEWIWLVLCPLVCAGVLVFRFSEVE